MAQVEKYIIGPKTKVNHTFEISKFLIANITFQTDVIDGLYDICDILPASEERSCEDFVGKYGDAIADMILAAMQPSEICSVLMICDDLKTKIERTFFAKL